MVKWWTAPVQSNEQSGEHSDPQPDPHSGPQPDPQSGPQQPGAGAAGWRFEGRVALVTGASRGIGLAVAERLVAEGARVCITARKPDPLREAVASLGGEGRAVFMAGNVDDPEHRATAVDAAARAFGRLDVLVNNAGINPLLGPVTGEEQEALLKLFSVNVISAAAWVSAARRAGLGQHPGAAVVNVASVAGLRPSPPIGAYGVSKAALVQLTAELAWELAPAIRVNAVAPAVVKTRFATVLYEGREAETVAAYPLGRLGVPADVASAVAFLAGDDAAWVTGQTLVLDGGMLLGGGFA